MIRAFAAIFAGVFIVCVGTVGLLISMPTPSPANPGAVSLAVLAAVNAKEGQGDVLGCASSVKGSAGAKVAAAAARAAGFSGRDLVVAVAVAGAESGWRATATNVNTNASVDYGMWQINSVHADLLASGDWRDPYSNAQMAHSVWADAGGSWTPWTTYTSGAYLSRLSAAQKAVGGSSSAVVKCSVNSGPVPDAAGHETGATIALRNAVHKRWPSLTIGCYRPVEDGGEHPRGRACDVMVGMALGNKIARWAQANAGPLHVLYIIHAQRIWGSYRAADGWRLMGDRGSPTANHMDHVHISVKCLPGDPAWAHPCLYQ